MLTKTDFLGNEYGPGDIIVYGQSSGRCINMIKAKVLEIKENGNVRVQPLAGSRWKGHHGKTYSVDNRTGKRIDPWAASGKHIKEPSCYVSKDGKKYTTEYLNSLPYWERSDIMRVVNYVPTVFHDYVETRTDPVAAVTLQVTENIVKLSDGERSTEA